MTPVDAWLLTGFWCIFILVRDWDFRRRATLWHAAQDRKRAREIDLHEKQQHVAIESIQQMVKMQIEDHEREKAKEVTAV